jgi:hypothetical protein
VRITPSDLSLQLVLALLSALLFIAPSGQACTKSRSFQMALWAESDAAPGIDTDIPVFYDGAAQPVGRSILIRFDLNKPFSAGEYDWSRIVAVLFDEPYNDFNNVACWSASTVAAVEARAQVLAGRAAELKSISPLTRFWVNLAEPQLAWVTTRQCVDDLDEDVAPVNVNKPYIDVISVDVYRKSFSSGLKRYYGWLAAHRAKPDQQLALIPGTFYRQGKDKPTTQASHLRGYFDYANNANRKCNLPLGTRGLTASFDGCPVWIVLGWLAHNHTEGGIEHVGERDKRSAPIAKIWQSQRALPLRPDLARAAVKQ